MYYLLIHFIWLAVRYFQVLAKTVGTKQKHYIPVILGECEVTSVGQCIWRTSEQQGEPRGHGENG